MQCDRTDGKLDLVLVGKVKAAEIAPSLGWILLAFAIFNTYMLLWSTRINLAAFWCS